MGKSVRQKDEWGGTLIEDNKDDWGGTLVDDGEKKNRVGNVSVDGTSLTSQSSSKLTLSERLNAGLESGTIRPLDEQTANDAIIAPTRKTKAPPKQFDPYANAIKKKPTVNVSGIEVNINEDIPATIPFSQQPQTNLAASLQERINSKTHTIDDTNVIARSLNVPTSAADQYIKGNINTGEVIRLDDIKNKNSDQLKITVTKANTDLGLNDKFEEVFATPESTSQYIQKIDKLYNDKANKEASATGEKEFLNSPAYLGAGSLPTTVAANEVRDKNLNAAQQIKSIVSNDIIEKITDRIVSGELNKDEGVKQIYNLVDAQDAANVERAITERIGANKNVKIWEGAQSNTKNAVDLLNSNKASIEFKVNSAMADKVKYNTALKGSLIEDYNSKVTSGEISPNDEEIKATYQQKITALDDENNHISPQVQSAKELYEKYPTLYQQGIADAVNEFNAIKSGNVQGYENKLFGKDYSGYEGITLEEHLRNNGIDPNDQKTKDFLKGDNFKDYSFFGNPLKNVLGVAVGTGKSVGDIVGTRDFAEKLSEKKGEGLFSTQAGANDQYKLTGAAETGQTIGNTTGQVIGQGLMQLGTAGIGRLAGLSKVAANSVGFWSSGTLSSYDSHYKETFDLPIETEVGRVFYAGANAIAEGATEHIFPEIKLFQIPGVRDAIADISSKIGTKGFTQELANELLNKAKGQALNYGKKYVKNISTETFEEGVNTAFNDVTKLLSGDQTIDVNRVIQDVKETAIQTAIGTSVIAGVGAHRDIQAERNVAPKSMIYNAAIYHDEALDAINKGFQQNKYSELERDNKIAVLNTAKNAVTVTAQTEKIAGVELTRPEKEVYVANLTAEALLKESRKVVDDPVMQESIDVKISNLQNQRKQILSQEVTIDDNGNIYVTKQAVKETTINKVADLKELSPETKALLAVHEDNPVFTGMDENERLKFIAEQAQNISNGQKVVEGTDNYLGMVEKFGDKLVTKAIEAYPEEKLLTQQPTAEPSTSSKSIEDFSNENESYRVIVGDEAFNDLVESGVVRTNADSKSKKEGGIDLGNRPTAFPSFSKGKASIDYAAENPNNYIIVTNDASIQPSKSGRHGKGTTMFPTDENGNHLKELSGEKVKVYKHIGEGKYELVYENGKLIESKQKQKAAEPSTVSGEEGKSGVVVEPKQGFTEGKDLNKMFADLKGKYGDKKGSALYEVANRLVNPNTNTIVEIRSNGVVVKEGDKYILKPFGNTDANSKNWVLYKGLDVTDQFAKQPSASNTIDGEQGTKKETETKVKELEEERDAEIFKAGKPKIEESDYRVTANDIKNSNIPPLKTDIAKYSENYKTLKQLKAFIKCL